MTTKREGKGSAYESRGKFFAQIAMGAGKRKGVLCPLATCTVAGCTHNAAAPLCPGLNEARDRAASASEIVAMLRDAKQESSIEGAIRAATTLPIDKLPEARKYAEIIAKGRTPAQQRGGMFGGLTFEKFAEKLTNGALRKDFPDHVGEVGAETLQDYGAVLREYINPKIGTLPLGAITLDHALDVMRHVPNTLSSSRRRAIAFVMRRVLALAVFPARVLAANPVPTGFLPKLDAPRARGFIFPDEEAQLLAGVDEEGRTVVPLVLRVLFGLLAREGLRTEEAASLEYSDKRTAGAAGWVDLDRGWLYLDRNKTDDARDWSLSPDVAEALRRWRKLAPSSRFVFPSPDDKKARFCIDHIAADLRAALVAAGVERMELFEDTEDRRHIVAHDLRAVFITTALAQGKPEGWIQRRTGHTTSQMLARYRRRAAELEEGERARLAPMHEAIPELVVCGPSAPSPNDGERKTKREDHGHSTALALDRMSSGSGDRKVVEVQVLSIALLLSASASALLTRAEMGRRKSRMLRFGGHASARIVGVARGGRLLATATRAA